MIEFFPSRKILLALFGGKLTVTWYAALIMAGAFAAYYLSKRNMRKMKYPDEYADDMIIDVLWTGILGARLWFCAFYDFSFYITHPLEILAIWDGGLAIQGGIIGAGLYACYFAKKRGLNVLRLGDAVLPNVLLSQTIGRWGNFVNQECHGPEVSEAYYDGILSFIKEGMHIGGKYYEPMFLYESVLCLIGFILIVGILKRFKNKRGDLMFAYFMWYGLIRFFIEGRRTDSLMFGPFKMAQLTSFTFIAIGVLGYLGFFDRIFNRQKPTILFDLDGTLIDTERGIVETYREIFKRHGREKDFTKEVELEVLGPSLISIFTKYFGAEKAQALTEEYCAYNYEIFLSVNKPMPEALEVLRTLKKEGYNIGVVSTKYHDDVANHLRLFDMAEYVDDIVGGDDVKFNKPNPEGINKILSKNRWYRDQMLYIGDSASDIEAGINAGAYTVGFYFNEERKDAITNAGANVYISDLSQLLDILKEKHNFTHDLS